MASAVAVAAPSKKSVLVKSAPLACTTKLPVTVTAENDGGWGCTAFDRGAKKLAKVTVPSSTTAAVSVRTLDLSATEVWCKAAGTLAIKGKLVASFTVGARVQFGQGNAKVQASAQRDCIEAVVEDLGHNVSKWLRTPSNLVPPAAVKPTWRSPAATVSQAAPASTPPAVGTS